MTGIETGMIKTVKIDEMKREVKYYKNCKLNYVTSSFDVVIFLNTKNTNSKYIHYQRGDV